MNFTARKLRQAMIDNRAAGILGFKFHCALRGHQAFERGETPVDCPWPLGSVEQHSWVVGWLNSFDARYSHNG